MATDSVVVGASVRPKRRLLQFGLSTLVGVVVLAAILFAVLRPKPKDINNAISHHNIEYPAKLEATRKAAAKQLSTLIEQKKVVGTTAIALEELAYATLIDIRSDRVEYHLALDQPYEGGNVAIVVVDSRTGLVTHAFMSVYKY